METTVPAPCPTCPGGRAGPGGAYAYQRPDAPVPDPGSSGGGRGGGRLRLNREPVALTGLAALLTMAQVATGKLYEVQKYCALSNHCWSGYWIIGNRRALAGLPPDLLEIVDRNFDAAADKERADLLEMDRSLQTDLAGKGMTFNKPDPVQFRAALVKAGFYTQWQKAYGGEAWAKLEQYTGRLT